MSYNVKIGETVYTGVEAIQTDTGEGHPALYTETNTEINLQSDWDAPSNDIGYIRNKPYYRQSGEITWDGSSNSSNYNLELNGKTITASLLNYSNLEIKPEEFVEQKLTINSLGDKEIKDYCKTGFELNNYKEAGQSSAVVVKGTVYGLPSSSYVFTYIEASTSGINEQLYLAYISEEGAIAQNSPKGWYGLKTKDEARQFTKLTYNATVLNPNYSKFFKSYELPIHVLETDGVEALANIKFNNFKVGDIILIVSDASLEDLNGN